MSVLFESDHFFIDDDPALLDLDSIHQFLTEESYWGQNRSFEQVYQCMQHSYNLGAYLPSGELIGYARVVTDWTTFAWICDVFIVREARGMGAGKQLIQCIVNHSQLKNIRRMMLATRDAHDLYAQFGFVVEDTPEFVMKRILNA